MKIAVSILSSIYDEEETIKRINETDAEFLHVDVLDGSFVPQKTPKREFLHTCTKPLNVHLMVSRPFDYISTFKELGADAIIIQAELEDDLESLLKYIKELGMKCGLALSPATSVSKLENYLNLLDDVLVLCVEPGAGGQKMLEFTLEKIDELVKIRDERGYTYEIIVDGGVNEETIDKVRKADIAVVGSFICKSEDYQERINKLRLLK